MSIMARFETLENRMLLTFDSGDYPYRREARSIEHSVEEDIIEISILQVCESTSNFLIAATEGFLVTNYLTSGNAILKGSYYYYAQLNAMIPASKVAFGVIEVARFTLNFIFEGCMNESIRHLDLDHDDFSPEASVQNRIDFVSAFWQTYLSASTYLGVGVGIVAAYAAPYVAVAMKQQEKDIYAKYA